MDPRGSSGFLEAEPGDGLLPRVEGDEVAPRGAGGRRLGGEGVGRARRGRGDGARAVAGDTAGAQRTQGDREEGAASGLPPGIGPPRPPVAPCSASIRPPSPGPMCRSARAASSVPQVRIAWPAGSTRATWLWAQQAHGAEKAPDPGKGRPGRRGRGTDPSGSFSPQTSSPPPPSPWPGGLPQTSSPPPPSPWPGPFPTQPVFSRCRAREKGEPEGSRKTRPKNEGTPFSLTRHRHLPAREEEGAASGRRGTGG